MSAKFRVLLVRGVETIRELTTEPLSYSAAVAFAAGAMDRAITSGHGSKNGVPVVVPAEQNADPASTPAALAMRFRNDTPAEYRSPSIV